MNLHERLKEERERLGHSQTAFAALAGASKHAQINWEKGAASPNAAALAAWADAGLDVLYVVTGQRAGGAGSAVTTLDVELLTQVVSGVEQAIAKTGRSLTPNVKAKHIAALYQVKALGHEVDANAISQALARAA